MLLDKSCFIFTDIRDPFEKPGAGSPTVDLTRDEGGSSTTTDPIPNDEPETLHSQLQEATPTQYQQDREQEQIDAEGKVETRWLPSLEEKEKVVQDLEGRG